MKRANGSKGRKSPWMALLSLLTLTLLGWAGCLHIEVADDFTRPYENEDLLMPASSHIYTLSGPRGVAVDIAIDYEEKARLAPQLTVGRVEGGMQVGVRVPGSLMRRAVCGVVLDPAGGVEVVVQNQNLFRSVPFSLRIERAPSLICTPHTTAPSMVLVQHTP